MKSSKVTKASDVRDDQYLVALVVSQKAHWNTTHSEAMMITLEEYVGIHSTSPDWTPEVSGNAGRLLIAVDKLRIHMEADGVVFPVNPKTKTCISGETYGGFRPQSCPIGASLSTHKVGRGIDIFDPDGKIDDYLMTHAYLLDDFKIYIEHPDHTPTWSHWTDKPPRSGKHIFYP